MILFPVILHDFCTNLNILFLNIMQWMKTTCISKVFIKRLLYVHEGWLKKVENDAINKSYSVNGILIYKDIYYTYSLLYIFHLCANCTSWMLFNIMTQGNSIWGLQSILLWLQSIFDISKTMKKNPTPIHTKQNLRFVLCLETLWKRFWSNYSCSVNLFSTS